LLLLYVERWLQAPLQKEDGTLVEREQGSPQGSAISPLLANLFMHYAFDSWMRREFPDIGFERYCDDIVVHCVTKRQAEYVKDAIGRRLRECQLEIHPEKTRIVYCKDGRRRGCKRAKLDPARCGRTFAASHPPTAASHPRLIGLPIIAASLSAFKRAVDNSSPR
jgi:hypothetical protein